MYLCVFWQGVTLTSGLSATLVISFTSFTLVFTCPNRISRCQGQAFQAQQPKRNEKLCPTFRTPQASDVSILMRGVSRSGKWMWPFTVLQKEKWGHAKPFMFQLVVLWLCFLPSGLWMPQAHQDVTLQAQTLRVSRDGGRDAFPPWTGVSVRWNLSLCVQMC